MSVQSEITRLQQAKTGLASVLEQNGIVVPTAITLDAYPDLFAMMGENLTVGLYKAMFPVDGWTASGSNYTQSVTVTPLAGSPTISSDCIMASPVFVEDGYPDATQRLVRISAGIVDAGQKTIGVGNITCTTRGGKKPSSDVEVLFLAKKE